MQLTTRQLKQIIREEIIRLTESQNDLEQLINSDDPQVVMQGFEVAALMGEPIIFKQSPNRDVLALIRGVEPQEIISLLLSDQQHWLVMTRLARNPNITEKNMQKIASYKNNTSGESYVKENLAQNPNITVGILDVLAGSDDHRTVRHVAKNPKTSSQSLETIFKNWGLQDPPRTGTSTVIPEIINNENATNELLFKIAMIPYDWFASLAVEELQKRGVEIPYQQDVFSDEDSAPDDLYDPEYDYDSEDDDDEF